MIPNKFTTVLPSYKLVKYFKQKITPENLHFLHKIIKDN